MSENVTRWTIDIGDYSNGSEREDPNGQWVDYDDYASEKARADAAEERARVAEVDVERYKNQALYWETAYDEILSVWRYWQREVRREYVRVDVLLRWMQAILRLTWEDRAFSQLERILSRRSHEEKKEEGNEQ